MLIPYSLGQQGADLIKYPAPIHNIPPHEFYECRIIDLDSRSQIKYAYPLSIACEIGYGYRVTAVLCSFPKGLKNGSETAHTAPKIYQACLHE